MMAARVYKISISSKTVHLARVRRRVAEWAAEAGLSLEEVGDIQCAVDEACANAIEHGYAGRPDGSVEIEAKINARSLVVTVRQHGQPFKPALHHLATLGEMRTQRRPHGYGLHLIQKLVDDVRYTARGRTSEVRLTKRRGPSS